MSWKSVIQELGCYVMSSKPIGVSVSDMRHSGHVPPLSESGHGAPAALSHPCPKWSASQARAYWGDLACVMNVIFSEPTRRLLARAVCHNPSKQITRKGPSWRKGTDLGSLSDPRLEMQKTLSEVDWQRQETAKAFFLWHMNMRRKSKTINNILFCSDWTFVRCGSSFKTREEQEQEAY